MKAYNKVLGAFSLVTLILGLVAVGITAVYLVSRFISDRAYNKKWSDYDDCGVA